MASPSSPAFEVKVGVGGWVCGSTVLWVLCVYSGKFVQGQALPGHKSPEMVFLQKKRVHEVSCACNSYPSQPWGSSSRLLLPAAVWVLLQRLACQADSSWSHSVTVGPDGFPRVTAALSHIQQQAVQGDSRRILGNWRLLPGVCNECLKATSDIR